MTDNEIDALPAGPEMDYAMMAVLPIGWDYRQSVSTDAGVALAALERWAETKRALWTLRREFGKGYECRIYLLDMDEGEMIITKSFLVRADTLALAVCRALLKASNKREIE